jgi:hypothetical protein
MSTHASTDARSTHSSAVWRPSPRQDVGGRSRQVGQRPRLDHEALTVVNGDELLIRDRKRGSGGGSFASAVATTAAVVNTQIWGMREPASTQGDKFPHVGEGCRGGAMEADCR